MCSIKKACVFLKNSQYSHKNTCVGVSPLFVSLLNIAKFLRTPILKNIHERLLMTIPNFYYYQRSYLKTSIFPLVFQLANIIPV